MLKKNKILSFLRPLIDRRVYDGYGYVEFIVSIQ